MNPIVRWWRRRQALKWMRIAERNNHPILADIYRQQANALKKKPKKK